jgi:hypothetical protein
MVTPRFLAVVFLAVTSLVTQARPLPSSYSLADAGFMIPIKDQGVLGTCWTFSSSTVFETSLVRQGLLPVSAASNLTSEWDMAIHDGAFTDLVAPYNGWGGFPYEAIGYYTRGFGRWKLQGRNFLVGGGPVLRTGDPLNAYPLAAANNGLDLSPYVPPANQPLLSGYRLTQALEFVETDSGAARGKAPTRAFRDIVKHAILRYGALDTNMNAAFIYGPPFNTFNFKSDTYAYTGNSLAPDHDVTIIGWNDDVPVYDASGQLLGTGAWLIQNSWGKSFANSKKAVPKPDGCFWLGYCDTVATKYCCAMVPERRRGLSNVVLQNQFFFYANGLSGGFPAGTPTLAATKLVPQTDTKLLRVGLWTVADRCAVDIRIYGGWGTRGPVGAPLTELRDILIPTRGYSEVPLLAPLWLTTGRPIYVVVDFGANLDYPAALDNKSLAVKDILNFDNLSWVSKDGRHWEDLFADAGQKEKGIWILKGILGRDRARPTSATLSVTSVRAPLVTSDSSLKLRGVNSYNTERVLWRLGKGRVRAAKGGTLAWQITVRGLKPGKNVVSIWPTTATGVATSPVKVTIVRR